MEQAQQIIQGAEKLGVSVKDAIHYARALVTWASKGFPMRTDEEVDRIYNTVCVPCENNVGNRCKKCGCRLSKNGLALTNKIRMGTEQCPENRWPPLIGANDASTVQSQGTPANM